jgi:hypothetical protein
LVGDARLDGAPASALLGDVGPVWYVAPDREALLRQAPSGFTAAFTSERGHPPSTQDVLAYVQTGAAVGDGIALVDPSRLPLVLYAVVAGRYPGSTATGAPGLAP